MPKGISKVSAQVPQILEDASNELPDVFRQLIARLLDHFRQLHCQVADLEKQITAWHRDNQASRKLAKIPGIGPLGASALVATIGDAKTFKNGRQLAAWLGLVPRQHSSGGKPTLLGISKRGDVYLRTLLIHGSRSAILAAQRRADHGSWLAKLLERRHTNVAAAALANKNSRTVWALLAHDRTYQPGYVTAA